jgi:hypothetical protein
MTRGNINLSKLCGEFRTCHHEMPLQQKFKYIIPVVPLQLSLSYLSSWNGLFRTCHWVAISYSACIPFTSLCSFLLLIFLCMDQNNFFFTTTLNLCSGRPNSTVVAGILSVTKQTPLLTPVSNENARHYWAPSSGGRKTSDRPPLLSTH